MNVVFLLTLFVIPRFLAPHSARMTKLGAIVVGSGLFLFAKYGGAFDFLPDPADVVSGSVWRREMGREATSRADGSDVTNCE